LSFTDIFIRRPVLATVVSALILIIGLQAIFSLQIRQYPELSSTTITVTTAYPGANADLIKGFITTPLMQAVASTEGIDTLISSSQQNVSTITLNLLLNADGNKAATDVLSKVSQVRGILPDAAQDPVVVKQTGEGFALMYLSFNSERLTASQITDYLTRTVQPRLQTIDGVAEARILGGETFAMRVWLDPDRMASRGITPLDVRSALLANNFTTAAGQIKGDFVQTSINALTSLDNAAAFGRLVIAAREDTLIRLSDIARIELGPAGADSSSTFDGLKAVFIGVYGTPTANPLTLIENVRNAIPDIASQLPPTLKTAVAYDSTEFIQASINEVVKTLGEAALIVVVVIFLFLGSLRSTLIPIVTIPLSLVGVMGLLLAFGFTINLLTLLALVLAIGLVVDDANVVVENIHRHIEDGLTPFDAALTGAREIAVPVIAMTITLAAVYTPIGFVSGLTGALFKEFAFTLAGAVIVSGVIALTLSPMMCSRLLVAGGKGAFTSFLDRAFDRLRHGFQRTLHATLGYRSVTLMVLAVVIGLTGLLYVSAPQELAPEEDQGILFALLKAPAYANLDYLESQTDKFATLARTLEETDHIFAINGSGGVHQAFAGILLKPWDQRSRDEKQVSAALQPLLAQLTGVQAFAFSPPALPGSTGGTPVQFVITSNGSFEELAEVLQDLQQRAFQSGLFLFVDSDLKFDTPQFEFRIDADKANQLGISMQDIGLSLAILLGGNDINRFNLYGRSYEVVPQVPRDFRLTEDWLTRYQVRTTGGRMVPLSTVATVARSVQPNALTTFQQLNAATLSGVAMPGRTLGEALEFLETTALETFPPGFSYDFSGESRQFVQEGNTLVLAFALALIIIYLVLAAQYESFRDPFIILIALPTSMFGALLPIYIGGLMGLTSVNIYTQVGLMTLIGLISKHGILMVDFANRLQREQGLGRREAIEEAAAVRLRPILMTTAAMVLAMLPLLIASGAGARSRFDMGLVIAAGMAVGTMFTLFVTPAVYTFLARDHSRSIRTAAPGNTVVTEEPAP
jgi:multidrug efflux pump